MRSGASPTLDQKTSSASSSVAHRRVAHLGTEQHRTRFEATEPVARTPDLPRHDQRVVPPPVPEHAKVRVAEDLRAGLEGDPVSRYRDPGALLAVADHPVVVHPDLAAVVVDVHVGRGDMGMEMVLLDRPLGLAALRLADRRGVRAGGGEMRRLEREGPRRVHAPRARDRVRDGQPNVGPLVIGEVEVVPAERRLDPVRNPDERRSVDVRAHPSVHVGPDDRLAGESCRPHRTHASPFAHVRPRRRSMPRVAGSTSRRTHAGPGRGPARVPAGEPVRRTERAPGYANGFPISAKYLRVTLNTMGASSRSPMRFGTAISPLRVSDRFHTKSTFTFANESAASTHNAR